MPLSPANQAAILEGVAKCDGTFYTLGAAMLVVVAGIFGFYRVYGLLGEGKESGTTDYGYDIAGTGDYTDVPDDSEFQRPWLSQNAEHVDRRSSPGQARGFEDGE